jgi:hypothetical protein
MIAHILLVKVFGLKGEDGETMEAFLESHLDILMNGLVAKPGGA